jgi:hypothetical protein
MRCVIGYSINHVAPQLESTVHNPCCAISIRYRNHEAKYILINVRQLAAIKTSKAGVERSIFDTESDAAKQMITYIIYY